jgi:hypothetical protein
MLRFNSGNGLLPKTLNDKATALIGSAVTLTELQKNPTAYVKSLLFFAMKEECLFLTFSSTGFDHRSLFPLSCSPSYMIHCRVRFLNLLQSPRM